MLISGWESSPDDSLRPHGQTVFVSTGGGGAAVGDGTKATGSAEGFGPWETLYSVFRRSQIDGTCATVLKKRQFKADAVEHVEWEVSVDATISRAHQHAAAARKEGLPIQAGRPRTGRPCLLLSKDPGAPAPSADPSRHSRDARPGRPPPTPRGGSGFSSRHVVLRHATGNSPSATKPPSNSP